MTTTTATEPDRRARSRSPAPRSTYDVRRNDATHRADPVPDRLTDGRRGLRHARRPLRGPHRRHLRPARHASAAPPTILRQPVTPEDHADDLHRIIEAVGRARSTCSRAAAERSTRSRSSRSTRRTCGRSSAHEPPLAIVLPDREHALAAARAIHDDVPAQLAGAPAWPTSSPSSATRGRSRPRSRRQPGPDPAMFGMPAEDDGTRTDPMLGQNVISTTRYEPDFDALRRRLDPDRARRRRGVRGRAGEPRRATRWPSGSGTSRSASRATTVASSAASTARPATPTPSPRSSATSSRGAERTRTRSTMKLTVTTFLSVDGAVGIGAPLAP